MPLRNEVLSLREICTKKVANMVIDSVKYITKEYGDYDRQACAEKVFELQRLLFRVAGTHVHDIGEEIQIEVQRHKLVASTCRVLFAVLIRSDMKDFKSMILPISVQVYLFDNARFWKSRLDQFCCLEELDVKGLHPNVVAKCNYFQEISKNCKDTLKKVSFPFSNSENALLLLNNLQKCKELESVVGFCDYLNYMEVSSQYAMGVKMFVESLPKLSTLTLPDMYYILLKYEDLDMLGFSSTSLTGIDIFTFPGELTMLQKLLYCCPNIEKMSLRAAFPHPYNGNLSLNDLNIDLLLMKCLDSCALRLKSLSVIIISHGFRDKITLLTSIGANLQSLKLDLCYMTASDFFVLGQVCPNLEELNVEVREFTPPEPTHSFESLVKQASTCVIFTKLKSLSITSNCVPLIFNSYEQLEGLSMDLNILPIILKNASELEKMEFRMTFHNAFHVIIPFFQDGTLENLTHLTYCGNSDYFPLSKHTIRLVLAMCPKLSFVELMTTLTNDAKLFVGDYCDQIASSNLALEMEVLNGIQVDMSLR